MLCMLGTFSYFSVELREVKTTYLQRWTKECLGFLSTPGSPSVTVHKHNSGLLNNNIRYKSISGKAVAVKYFGFQ